MTKHDKTIFRDTRWLLLVPVLFLLGCQSPEMATRPEGGLRVENAWMVLNSYSNTVSYSLEVVNGSNRARRVLWTDATVHPETSFILQNTDTKAEFVLDTIPRIMCGGALETFVVRPGKRKALNGNRDLRTRFSPLYFWPWDSAKLDPKQAVDRQGIVGDKRETLPSGNYSARVQIRVTWWDGHFSYGLESLQSDVLSAPATFSFQSPN